MQGLDGGFREEAAGGATNAATTAWVVQGMWASGVDPREWSVAEGGPDPLSFLASLQRADGSIGWTAESDTNSLWMTAQVGPALAGRFYPLAAVPRAEQPPPRSQPGRRHAAAGHRARAVQRGHGGSGTAPGDGVLAGGGGRGAPLFSAPQPQSAGSTPRGVRSLSAARDSSGARGSGAAGVGVGPAPAPQAGEGEQESGTVEGLLVAGGHAPAAPGLFAADAGGSGEPAIVAMLIAAILAAAAVGSRREGAGVRLS